MKNNLIQNSDQISEKKINWEDVQIVFKEKFGSEIFESWLKKIVFVEEYKNYLLLSVSTRFIRDWITSRYLDQILQIIKIQKIINNKYSRLFKFVFFFKKLFFIVKIFLKL